MTARPPLPLHEALSAEERALADRLAKLDAGAGPTAALDARILGAARASAATGRRAQRRWPAAAGAAAVLVAAVGLAWQLKPMFALGPPPLSTGASAAGAESEVVVQVEPVPRRATSPVPPVAEAGDAAVRTAPAAAPRRAAPSAARATTASAPRPQAKAAPRMAHEEFLDEALPPVARAADVEARSEARTHFDAPLPPPAPPAAAPVAADAGGDAITVTGSRIRAARPAATLPDVATDARLSTRAWLARIRERRLHGDIDGARTSLERFVIVHPRVSVPRDLRPLLRDGDPWSP